MPALTSRRNFLVEHWRGELGLAESFWFIGAGGYVLLLAAFDGIYWMSGRPLSPGAIVPMAVFLVAFMVWQSVGLWRSAGNSMRPDGSDLWPVLARVAVVLYWVQLVVRVWARVG